MTEINNLPELTVTKSVAGVLETNIESLEAFVNARLEDYKPELYLGDADMAKKDRAELNKSKKFLSEKRRQIMDTLTKPYQDFEARCKALEKKIDTASGLLDAIVKDKDEKEKAARRIHVLELWNAREFSLLPIDRVFNAKWLNKTAKDADIEAEMDAIIVRTYSDLKQIDKYAEPSDAETVKAYYLDCLDIGDALGYGEQLAKNREKVKQEAAERANREHESAIQAQVLEQKEEAARLASGVAELAAEASGIELKDTASDYVVSVKATAEQMSKLKAAMNAIGIEYTVEELQF